MMIPSTTAFTSFYFGTKTKIINRASERGKIAIYRTKEQRTNITNKKINVVVHTPSQK